MIGDGLKKLGGRVLDAIEQAVNSLSPPGAESSLGLAGVGAPVGDLSALSAPVAAKGAPRDEGKDSKTGKKPRKDIAPIVSCDGHAIQISQASWDNLALAHRERIRHPQSPNELVLVGVVATTLNQLYRRKPEYINEAATRILNYRGVPKLLKQVFDTCGSYDPIALGKELEVHVIPADKLSPADLRAHYQSDEQPGEESETALTIRSDSGAALKSTPHVLIFKKDSKIVAIGGRQLMTSHCEALFGATPEVTRERRRRVEGNVGDSILAPLVGMSIAQILDSEDLRDVANRSPLLARQLEAYDQLRPMLAEAHSVIQNALFGVGLNAEKVECLRLKADAGGQLLSWCEANARTMPEALQADLERLLYSPHELSLKEQQQIVARLATYRISHSTINLEVALGPLTEDLAALKALPKTDPLYKPELERIADDAIAEVTRNVAADSSNEIRLDRLPDLLESPMTAFRRAVNTRELEPYKEEFLQALAAFKPLFCDGDRFKEGFRGESVPLTLLGSTLYGADIGTRRFDKSAEKQFPALSRNDFYFVKEALFYQMVSADTEQLCKRLSIPRFKELVLGVVAAHRKAADLDNQYRTWYAAQANPEDLYPPPAPGDHLTCNIDVARISTFTPTVLQGGKIRPAEEFAKQYGVDWAHCIHSRNFEFRNPSGSPRDWDARAPLERYLRDARLCDFGLPEDVLNSLARGGKAYLTESQCSDVVTALERYEPNSFILKPFHHSELSRLKEQLVRLDVFQRALIVNGFLEAEDVQQSFAPLLAGQPDGSISIADREIFTKFLSTTFVVGEVSEKDGKKELSFRRCTGLQLLGEPNKRAVTIASDTARPTEDQVEWFDPSSAMKRCKEILAQSVSIKELHTEPLIAQVDERIKVRRETSRRANTSWDNLADYAKAYGIVYEAIQFLNQGNTVGTLSFVRFPQEPISHWLRTNDYPDHISRELLETINNWLQKDAEQANRPIGKSGWFEFRDGVPVMVKGQGQGVEGRALDDVLYSIDRTYITSFLRHKLKNPPAELVELIDQMIAAKSRIDSRGRFLDFDQKRAALRSELVRLCRDI